jgi:hypothetical protein
VAVTVPTRSRYSRAVPESDQDLPLATRLWFAWACFFRVLLDGAFAARAFQAQTAPRLSAGPPRASDAPEPRPSVRPSVEPPGTGPALQLLALFQREGRFVDFLEQDIASFNDGEIGAVARVVHEGCRKALHEHAELSPVRAEEEGTAVTLQAGFNPSEVKLSGNLSGSAPYKGVLRHRGWRASQVKLPAAVTGHDASVIAPAEIEL